MLKLSPDILADCLDDNDFVYLTNDTPSVRKMIVSQYVNHNTDLCDCYAHVEEGFNPYELILCTYQQINPERYYTLSGRGISQIQNATESSVTSLADWERERAIFLYLRKLSFFK